MKFYTLFFVLGTLAFLLALLHAPAPSRKNRRPPDR